MGGSCKPDAPAPSRWSCRKGRGLRIWLPHRGAGQAYLTNASFDPHPSTDGGEEFAPASALSSSSNPAAYGSHAVLLGPGQQAQTELEGLASRYSAWMGGGTTLGSRSGTPGFRPVDTPGGRFRNECSVGRKRPPHRARPSCSAFGWSFGRHIELWLWRGTRALLSSVRTSSVGRRRGNAVSHQAG